VGERNRREGGECKSSRALTNLFNKLIKTKGNVRFTINNPDAGREEEVSGGGVSEAMAWRNREHPVKSGEYKFVLKAKPVLKVYLTRGERVILLLNEQ